MLPAQQVSQRYALFFYPLILLRFCSWPSSVVSVCQWCWDKQSLFQPNTNSFTTLLENALNPSSLFLTLPWLYKGCCTTRLQLPVPQLAQVTRRNHTVLLWLFILQRFSSSRTLIKRHMMWHMMLIRMLPAPFLLFIAQTKAFQPRIIHGSAT